MQRTRRGAPVALPLDADGIPTVALVLVGETAHATHPDDVWLAVCGARYSEAQMFALASGLPASPWACVTCVRIVPAVALEPAAA